MSSKIKVDTIENVAGSGNVSLGSGHNLVVPGNITGQGTAAITGNTTVGGTLGVTGATTLSSTANVGSALTMSGNDFANHIQMNNGGTGGTTFNIYSTSDAFAQPAGHWMLHTSSATSGIILADQNGRVRMQYQPSFRAGMTANQTVAQNDVVTYQTTDHNIGNHFDTSSNVGRFTCPVAGRYLFGIAMGDGNNSGIAGIFALCKNGSRHYDFLEGGAPSGISGHYEKHASVVVNASANDYFDIRQISSGNKNLEGTADGLSTRNRFWGHMLG